MRLSYSSTRKESGLCCAKVYWIICIWTIAGVLTIGCPLPISILTRMASLEMGNWVLRGIRTVVTAGTRVAFGFPLASSGVVLDLPDELLGSVGGVRPDILTQTKLNFCDQLQLNSVHASLAQRAQHSQKTKKVLQPKGGLWNWILGSLVI